MSKTSRYSDYKWVSSFLFDSSSFSRLNVLMTTPTKRLRVKRLPKKRNKEQKTM